MRIEKILYAKRAEKTKEKRRIRDSFFPSSSLSSFFLLVLYNSFDEKCFNLTDILGLGEKFFKEKNGDPFPLLLRINERLSRD